MCVDDFKPSFREFKLLDMKLILARSSSHFSYLVIYPGSL